MQENIFLFINLELYNNLERFIQPIILINLLIYTIVFMGDKQLPSVPEIALITGIGIMFIGGLLTVWGYYQLNQPPQFSLRAFNWFLDFKKVYSVYDLEYFYDLPPNTGDFHVLDVIDKLNAQINDLSWSERNWIVNRINRKYDYNLNWFQICDLLNEIETHFEQLPAQGPHA